MEEKSADVNTGIFILVKLKSFEIDKMWTRWLVYPNPWNLVS